ncbi:NfeD family protein [Breznakiella homolactica]|uniref:Nodulation protein NfeD n=1 Tax=Breznakiella homolactica TaxID=2798577 RepID=A0A7T8BBU7_9SPIR|nr:NfeD family protein [Breznakiella homolactica]QQO10445.1 nodulation protein NfeD [Breznakiella homolactica]
MNYGIEWKKLCCRCLFFVLAFGITGFSLQAQTPETSLPEGTAWIIPVKGDITNSLSTFVRREARKALSEGASHIVFEIDTFGGRVDSALQITSFIVSIKSARTVAWVNNSSQSMGVSWSAGALIALACADIYMANGTSIGAAAPVTVSASGETEATGEKTVAAVRSQMAALAERSGHPVGIALAMVDQDIELLEISVNGSIRAATVQDTERLERDASLKVERLSVISPAGKLLSLTAGEAYKYGLAKGLADDREALFTAIGVRGDVTESAPSLADTIVFLLTSGPVQALLIIAGLIMLFLELQSPGFGVPGVVAIIAFILVFGSNALLGTVGSLEMILFLIGIGLLAVEIFILPGFGIAGISGLILIALSLIFSMQDFIIPRFDWEWGILGRNVVVVLVGLVVAIAGIAVIALMGPKIKLFDRLTLKAAITGTAGGPDPDTSAVKASDTSQLAMEDEEDLSALVGKEGKAASTLRPSGKADIDGRLYTVEADGEFIEPGAAVQVVRVRGNRIIVKSC